MPKSKRDKIKQKHEQIEGHIAKAIIYLGELHDMFEEHHPEYSKGYANIIAILLQALEFVQTIKAHI